MLFECGWEVCWQLGGIYTVLRTKARAMQERWGDRYFLIGPYNPTTAATEFEETPSEGLVRQALDKLREQGIPCHYGRWLVPGRPKVILLDYRARFGRLGDDKYLLWNDHGIGTDASDGEVNEVVAFGFTVTEFFRSMAQVAPGQKMLAHFHEWMGGVAVPRIAHEKLPVTTVFTTHATLLGRYLASDNPGFYDNLPYFNGDEQAAKYQILPRHLIEKAAAHASTVFTTVSDVTGYEAEKLLGRTADVIVPNGLDIRRFEAPHEFQHEHNQIKATIHKFVMGHFFPSYSFDLERTLYFFTSGRYEYKNKGIDIFIEALAKLNHRLKQIPNPPTIVSFIVTRAAIKNINIDALQGQASLCELQKFCEGLQDEFGRRIFFAASTGRDLQRGDLIDEEVQIRLKRFTNAMRTHRQPLIVTHDLVDDAGDPTLKHLRHRGLLNSPDDPVKVVFHPQFVTATSPLIGLDYDQFVRGCHLGVFPSYYEPWGYTPMECIASGVPAVTTDLAGFGSYVKQHVDRPHEHGITVVHRRNKSFDQAADELADYMMYFASLQRRQRIELRNKTEAFSDQFDWEQLAKHYHQAHDLALERTNTAQQSGKVEVRMV
ncbi:MAG: glycosyltransferase [Burkholderiales bacterium]|nr:glycosyltransferase [Phycisphaerae bacterium]